LKGGKEKEKAAEFWVMDKIKIKDLFIRTIIGTRDEERLKKQDVVINVTLWTDLSTAGKSDRIEDTINYRSIKKRIYNMVEESRYYLIEAMAEEVAQLCLEDPKVSRVEVSVEKPGALRFARTVGVEISRERDPRS
jgi:dihydroneopterin aldolase/D-erythro-7,8-dihydroneopterin triphosphate epimerase